MVRWVPRYFVCQRVSKVCRGRGSHTVASKRWIPRLGVLFGNLNNIWMRAWPGHPLLPFTKLRVFEGVIFLDLVKVFG